MSTSGLTITPGPSRCSTPPPKAKVPVCPGAPGRTVKSADHQPVSGHVSGMIEFGNIAKLTTQMSTVTLGSD